MQPRSCSKFLIALSRCLSSPGLALVVVLYFLGLGQARPAQATEEAKRRPLDALIKVLDAGTYVERDAQGAIVFLALPGSLLSDSNLVLVSRLETVRDLRLYGLRSVLKITGRGVAAFAGRTNLVSLRLKCFGECPTDVWQAVCNLRQLQRLDLIATSAAGGDYGPFREFRG